MDISTALTTEEIAVLSDPDRTFVESTQRLTNVNTPELRRRIHDVEMFEESLRFKNALDIGEEQARASPSWQRLSVLLNCEYHLYILNEKTPLRQNPFLSHWVETIQRLATTNPARPTSRLSSATDGSLGSDELDAVRVGLLKALLQSHSRPRLADLTPRQLYKEYLELHHALPFDIRPYVQILEEEGIYEKVSSGEVQEVPHTRDASLQEAAAEQLNLSHGQSWKQSILARLENKPQEAISDLTHLPIELSYLDFLTTLLQDKTLQRLSIEPSPVIRNYIQHALRLAEQMGQPPVQADEDSSNAFAPRANGALAETSEALDHSRAAQIRAVKLLLLFMRNLIRKALIAPDAVYFEIQEICVRYVWIKEVREFRAFIEEGANEVANS